MMPNLNNTSALFRYGKTLNTHDGLKILGILLMVIDHLGLYVFDNNMACRLIGRAAAPVFFFLIGYSGKVHITLFLIVYGIILSITSAMIEQHFWLDILISFVMIHFLLQFYKLETLSFRTRLIAFIVLTLLSYPIYPYLEYGFLGVLITYSARSLALNERFADTWMIVSLIVYVIYQIIVFKFIMQPVALVWLGVLFITLFLLFSYYRQVPLFCPLKLQLPALFISRYSLHIYFYHVILLQIYCFAMYPRLLTQYFHYLPFVVDNW